MDQPLVSVITPSSRGLKTLKTLLRDFANQTFRNFEHVIVRDGTPEPEIAEFMKLYIAENPYTRFVSIPKDTGNMMIAPGTRPRNYGVSVAKGEWVIFADDDDRYRGTYIEALITGTNDRVINIVQMGASEHRINGGDPTRFKMIPEAGLPYFPMICHVGTPCSIVKREWALAEPWRDEREHDFHFIRRICEKYQLQVRMTSGMQVDVDGIIRGMKDWVSIPPFYRQHNLL